MTVGTRSGGGALRKQESRVSLLQAVDEKCTKLEDFWNAKTDVVRNKLDRHGAGDTSWIEKIAECPVYYPTREDFVEDPLHYIQRIAAEASKYGMCKIVSPVVASVPAGFVLSKEQSGFKFTTRVQPMRLSYWDKDDKITFPMSGRNYTLTEYEKMANRVFSRKYSTAGNLPPRFIESEFWRELAAGKIRTVEYATDVEGSAFSSSSMDSLGRSKWNLKGISRLPYSTLRLLENAIPGITDPMLYIGMLFSMFSWHIEDHYLYSINYQHCGAPKTWYGVPGDAALYFEKVVREHVYNTEFLRDTGKGAELDLLLEKTTMFTPKLLAEHGVPVYKAVQYPGEFIITFPRAYHAGFSHGFNCGEAVNFAMADWFSLGAEACLRYESLNRFPLLPHEKLLCKEAANISRINQSGHDKFSSDLHAHVKVAFVASMRSFFQTISSLKQRRAKITTSSDTNAFCGLCKHMCYVAHTSCKCFSEPTCLNHGEFFSSCTCEGERVIVLNGDFVDLEALARKFESELGTADGVQKFLSHDEGSTVAEGVQFERSLLLQEKESGETCKAQEGEENAKKGGGGIVADVELCDEVTLSDCRPAGQEEELSDTEVVQFKRRKVSLPQSKRFQIDEQEIGQEKSTVESTCRNYKNHLLGPDLSKKAVGDGVEADLGVSATVDSSNKSVDGGGSSSSSSGERSRKRQKVEDALIAPEKESLLSAELDLHCEERQAAESKQTDSKDSFKSVVDSPKLRDEHALIIEEGQDEEGVDKLSASHGIVPEAEEQQIPCIGRGKEEDVVQGRSDTGLLEVDNGTSSHVKEGCMEHTSIDAVRVETDPQPQITESLADETSLKEDLPIINVENSVSSLTEVMETMESVSEGKVDEANGGSGGCETTTQAAGVDEGKSSYTEGDLESGGCESDSFVPNNGDFLLRPPAEAQPPLADVVEVEKFNNRVPAKAQPLADLGLVEKSDSSVLNSLLTKGSMGGCGKLETANVSSIEPKKGLVIHLNRKVEQIHSKRKVVEITYDDDDKSSICENLMEQVDAFGGQSGESAWGLDQEVVSSSSDQKDGEWFSPSEPANPICGPDLMAERFGCAKAEEKVDSKPESLLEMGQVVFGQQGCGSIQYDNILAADGIGSKLCEPNEYADGRICEEESSSTQYSFAMPSLVPGRSLYTVEGDNTFGVVENLASMSCRRRAMPLADCCEWQKSQSMEVPNELIRGLSSAGVCMPPGNEYRWDFPLPDTRLDAHCSRMDSGNLPPRECDVSNFVDRPQQQSQNFRSARFEPNMNWGRHRLQEYADFSSRHSTGHAMSKNSQRFEPSYTPRPAHGNYHPFQSDNFRSMKYPRGAQRKENMRWEKRPKRHYSRGWRGGNLQNNRGFSGLGNPKVKGMPNAGLAASTSTASVHVEGYDPTKWEISPAARSWQYSSTTHYAPSGWAERRP